MEHVIRKLTSHNINEIVLAMGYKPDSIFDYFRHGHMQDIKLTYSLEDRPLGTAGAVKHADRHISQTIFVFNGDIFTDIDLSDMLRFHKEHKAQATIALTHVEDPTKFGVVETDGDGRVLRFVEKPPPNKVTSHWINAGIYILEPEVLDRIPQDEFYMFERGVFPSMLEASEPVYAYSSNEYWIDMGTPCNYQQLNFDLLQGRCTSPLYDPDALVDTDCVIKKSARIEGPVMLGKGCVIDDGVRLEGPSVLGPGCKVKDSAVISGSILWEKVVIGRNSSITNSIIAGGAKIKENTRLTDQILNHEIQDRSTGK